MDWAGILGGAVTAGPVGGLLGILGSGVTGWLSIKAKKQEAELRMQMLKLETDKASIEGANQAFTESQKAAAEEMKSIASVAPLADSSRKRSFLLAMYGLRTSCRPLLTWFAHLAALVAFFTVDSTTQAALVSSVFTMAFTYGGWWFGNQQMVRMFGK